MATSLTSSRGRSNISEEESDNNLQSPKQSLLFKHLSFASSARSNSGSNSSINKKSAFRLLTMVSPRRRHRVGVSTIDMGDSQTRNDECNVLQWMQSGKCPPDVLPKILAFAGPQKTALLQKTNRHWKTTIDKEATWKVLCEELYKWKEGDPQPESWKEFYRFSPCVPVDYATVDGALAVGDTATSSRYHRSQREPRQQSIRILLRPGKHYLKEAITIQAIAGVVVSIETMHLPKNVFRPLPMSSWSLQQQQHLERSECAAPSSLPSASKPRLRRLLTGCRSASDAVYDETEHSESFNMEENVLGDESNSWVVNVDNRIIPPLPKQAALILRTRRHNEPVIYVRQGTVTLKDVEIQHTSHGIDIWNGNSAVQVQPPYGPDDMPIAVEPRPSAVLDHVQVTSRSGRGVVCIDGGQVVIRDCAVHDCAATGVYVGGPGSRALLERTDVVRNGVGNRSRRGIARGHSGVYLEQGFARISDSNVSNNTLTGISSVSHENSILSLENSDLVSNGTDQLDIPPLGTNARRRSLIQNNNLQAVGQFRMRSGLLPHGQPLSASHSPRVD